MLLKIFLLLLVVNYIQNKVALSNIKFDSYLNYPVSQSIYLAPIEPSEITDVVSKMKSNTIVQVMIL